MNALAGHQPKQIQGGLQEGDSYSETWGLAVF